MNDDEREDVRFMIGYYDELGETFVRMGQANTLEAAVEMARTWTKKELESHAIYELAGHVELVPTTHWVPLKRQRRKETP